MTGKQKNALKTALLILGSVILCSVLMILLYDGISGGRISQTLLRWIMNDGEWVVRQGESFANEHGLL